MKTIEEVRENIGLCSGYADCICDYDHGYISDIISEIADNHVSIYYYDMKEFMFDHTEYVERAIDEFGWTGDLWDAIRSGEYLYITESIHEEIDEALQTYALNYLENEGIDKLSDEEIEMIESISYSDYDKLDHLRWDMDELIQKREEDEEEGEEEC